MPAHLRIALALVLVSLVAGCAARAPEGPAIESLSGVTIPLDIEDYEVVRADGSRGVFLKLSRLPDGVEHHDESDPARIVLDIAGPTGEETPVDTLPAGDVLVSRIHVSRRFGTLRVVLELQADDPPSYSVHPMADWVMIRLHPEDS